MRKFINKRKKFGFTLAEVLITLGIIGVVASMTIPSLLTDISNKKLKTQFLKTYGDLNQAAKLFYTNEGASVHDVDMTYTHSGWRSDEVLKKYMSYFKGYNEKPRNQAYDFWREYDARQNITQRNLDGSVTTQYPCDQSFVSLDINGRIFATDDHVMAHLNQNYPFGPKICVDINGIAPPNRMGYDRFVFVFTADNEVVPYTGYLWNGIASNVDVTKDDEIKNISKYCSKTENTNTPAHTCAYFALKDKSPTGEGTYWKSFLKK